MSRVDYSKYGWCRTCQRRYPHQEIVKVTRSMLCPKGHKIRTHAQMKNPMAMSTQAYAANLKRY